MEEIDAWLKRAYDTQGNRQLLDETYDEWARDYDQHIWASGNPYILVATGMVGRYLQDQSAKILDAGCGTGNMALPLSYLGYTNIEGLDPSQGMLDMAQRKGIYKALHKLTLGSKIDLPSEHYDAVVAAGVLTHGHAPAESLDGIVEILKPNGLVVFSLSHQAAEQGFDDKMESLTKTHKWHAVDQSQWFQTYPFSKEQGHLRHAVFVFRKS